MMASLSLGSAAAGAQARQPGATPRDTTSGRLTRDTLRTAVRDSLRPSTRDFLSLVESPPVVTHHTMRLHGASLAYTATAGMLPIRNDTTGDAKAACSSSPTRRTAPTIRRRGRSRSSSTAARDRRRCGCTGRVRSQAGALNARRHAPPPPYKFEDNRTRCSTRPTSSSSIRSAPVTAARRVRSSARSSGDSTRTSEPSASSSGSTSRASSAGARRSSSPARAMARRAPPDSRGYLADRRHRAQRRRAASRRCSTSARRRMDARQRPRLHQLPAVVRRDGVVPQEAARRSPALTRRAGDGAGRALGARRTTRAH